MGSSYPPCNPYTLLKVGQNHRQFILYPIIYNDLVTKLLGINIAKEKIILFF